MTGTLQIFSNIQLPSMRVSITEDDKAMIVIVPPEDINSNTSLTDGVQRTVLQSNEVFFFTREDGNLSGGESAQGHWYECATLKE